MSVSINGVVYSDLNGTNVNIVNGRVIIDGVEVTVDGVTGTNTREVVIRIEGAKVDQVTADGSVKCNNVTGNVNARGSVNCDDIGGAVDAGGSVNCDNVQGNVNAGGSVNCDDIGGSVTAGGRVSHG